MVASAPQTQTRESVVLPEKKIKPQAVPPRAHAVRHGRVETKPLGWPAHREDFLFALPPECWFG